MPPKARRCPTSFPHPRLPRFHGVAFCWIPRHYQSPEFIERLIDWMALHKLNLLHWHLTDDQG